MKALWRRDSALRLERTMLVLDLRSWVLEVTDAVTWQRNGRSASVVSDCSIGALDNATTHNGALQTSERELHASRSQSLLA